MQEKHQKPNLWDSCNKSSVCPPGSVQIPPCPGSFSCDNRTCVDMSQVCNGVLDCPRGEDELVCGGSIKHNQINDVKTCTETEHWHKTRDWSVNDVSMFPCVLMSTSSVQIRLCHHLAAGIPPFPVVSSPVWMDPVSPSIWQVLDHITEETIHFLEIYFNWSHCISLLLWIIIFV